MEQQALELIVQRLLAVLGDEYTLTQKGSTTENKPAIFKGEVIAYAVIYDKKKKNFILQSTDVSEGKVGTEWKNLSLWVFDATQDTLKDAESISNDFCEILDPSLRQKQIETVKKNKTKKEKGDERTVNAQFLINRFVTLFPDVKYAVTAQKNKYGDIVPIELVEVVVLPEIKELLNSDMPAKIEKMCDILSNAYKYGDLDVRAIVTLIILNSIEDKKAVEKMEKSISDGLLTAWQNSRKLKGKTFKPEKVKINEKLIAKQGSLLK